MTGETVLVLGGARSGKSRYAEEIALKSNLQKVYIATAQAFDDEMRDRIAEHQMRRNGNWINVEASLDLVGTIEREVREGRIAVVDCLTLWLSNHFLNESDINGESKRLAECAADVSGATVFVSNEVGSGIVPDNRLGRDFRDAQGRLNQMMAAVCDTVVLVIAGLPMMIKGKQPL